LVIDAIDFVVHLFSQEQRDNYAIEQLWKDAEEILVEDL
jgi:ribosomal silencing factor RsfS